MEVFSGYVDGVAEGAVEAVLKSEAGGARGAVRRCIVFTGGAQAAACVKALSALLVRFLQHLSVRVVRDTLRPLAGFAVGGEGSEGGETKAAKKARRKKEKEAKAAAAA